MCPRPHLSICDWKNVIIIRITSLYGSQPSSVVFAPKKTTFGSELQVSLGPRPHLRFLPGKQQLFYQNYKSLWLPDFAVDLWMQNSVHRSRMTLAYWSQPSSVVLCIPNSAFSIRITSLYVSQPSSVVVACKTASFGSELQVSMGPRLRLLICEWKTTCLDPEWQVSIGPRTHIWFFAFKTATLA